MIDLTSEMTIEIHDTVIERYGGLSGILCLGTVDYLAAKINEEPAHPHVPARSRGCEARPMPPASGANLAV